MKGIGDAIGFSDPVFRQQFKEKHNKEVEDDIHDAALEWQSKVFPGAAHTWDEVQHLKDNWDGPIVLKGIQHVEDARKAVEVGVQGIVVSNHGGRQLDVSNLYCTSTSRNKAKYIQGAIGSLEVLPEIVEAVGDKIDVLFDSGIRTGVDIIKALSLGAKGVLIGRPWVYGLGISGKAGAKDALRGILAVCYLETDVEPDEEADKTYRTLIKAWDLLVFQKLPSVTKVCFVVLSTPGTDTPTTRLWHALLAWLMRLGAYNFAATEYFSTSRLSRAGSNRNHDILGTSQCNRFVRFDSFLVSGVSTFHCSTRSTSDNIFKVRVHNTKSCVTSYGALKSGWSDQDA